MTLPNGTVIKRNRRRVAADNYDGLLRGIHPGETFQVISSSKLDDGQDYYECQKVKRSGEPGANMGIPGRYICVYFDVVR